MKKTLLILGFVLSVIAGAFAQNTCTYIFTLHDSYGDGWNGGSTLHVMQGSTLVGTIDLSTGSDGTDSLSLTEGLAYSLVWSTGTGYTWDAECSFEVWFNGSVIYSCPDASELGSSPCFTFIGCNDCYPPAAFATAASQYSTDISWLPDGHSSWEYVYGASGFDPDGASATPVATSDTFANISGLSANSGYDFCIRTVCDAATNEKSTWARLPFATAQDLPGTIPYATGFETTDDASDWVLANGNYSNKWAIGNAQHSTGSRALYISNNNGNGYGYDYYYASNVWAYRDIDLGTSGNPHLLSFDWKCEGYTYPSWNEYYDYMEVLMGIPDIPSGTHYPNGAVLLGMYYDETSWQQDNLLLSESFSGIQRLYFHWVNTDDAWSTYDPAAVDNISITEQACGSIDSLSVSGIQQNSVTLTPYTASNATDFVIYYKKVSDTEYDTLENVTASPSYTLGNLASGTYYNVFMKIDCGSGDLGFPSDVVTFLTACDAISTEDLPYTEDFEGYAAAGLTYPTCWDRIDTYNGYNSYPFITPSTSFAGSRSLNFYTSSDSLNVAILPEIDMNVDIRSLTLSFMIKGYNNYSGSTWHAIVGVMDSVHDITTFVPVDTVTATSYNNWNSADISFANYTGSGRYIAIMNSSYDTTYNFNSFFIDDVTLFTTSSCLRPVSLTASNVLADSVTLSWTPQGNESSWLVAVVPVGGSPDSVTAIPCTANSTVVGGLTPNTTYEAYVKADCGAEASIWSAPSQFLTQCGTYTVPFLEDFNAGDMPPTQCWEIKSGYLDSLSILSSASYYGWNSSTDAMIAGNGGHVYNNIYGTSRNHWLISPSIDLGDGSTPAQVEMDLLLTIYGSMGTPNTNGVDDKFAIVVSLDNGQTWMEENAFVWDNDTASNSYGNYNDLANLTHVEIPLRNANGQAYSGVVRIALYGESTVQNADNNLRVDNFAVYPLSSCPRPSHLTLNGIGQEQLTASWHSTGNENGWNVAIIPADSTFSTDMLIPNWSDTTYTFYSLSPNTTYTVYVQSDCGTESSQFSTATGKTLCNSIDSLPFFEGFEGYSANSTSFPDCWYKHNLSGGTSPNISSYSVPTGNRAMYFYAYSGDLLAIMPQFNASLYPLNTLQVSFNLKSSSPDAIMAVGYVTNPSDPNTFVGMDTLSCPIPNTVESFDVLFNGTTVTDGMITFKVISNNYSDYYFYLDDITVDIAASCLRPSNLHLESSSLTSVDLAWTAVGDEDEWEVAYDTVGFNPDNATPVNVYTTPATTIHNLSDTITYEFYVRAVCGAGETSDWRGPIAIQPGTYNLPITGTNTVSMCGGHIYDNGGPDNDYSTYCNSTLTIQPDAPGMVVQVQGSYDIEDSYDFLRIYDGSDASTLLAEYTGRNGTIPVLTSSTGPITIVFTSDYTLCYDGFDLAVSCVPAPTCIKPFNLSVDATTSTDVTLSWTERGSATSWEVEYGTTGFTPGTGTTVAATTNPFTVSNLTMGTSYDFYVRSVCGAGDESEWTSPVTATPGSYNMPTSGEYTLSLCGGVIYDDGGPSGNYSDNCDVTVVVNPDQTGLFVQLDGTYNIETGASSRYDYLQIFDGGNTDGTLLFDSHTDNSGTLSVTSTTGPLTIYFKSDGSVQRPGFELQVSCVGGQTPAEPCDAPTNLTVVELADNTATLTWDQTGTPDSWTVSYRQADAATWSMVTTTSKPYSITNLTTDVEYEAFVVANCEDTVSGESNHITFTLTGVNDHVMDNTLLYPNPTTGKFRIENSELRMGNVEVYDVYGKLLQAVEVNDNAVELDASAYASGMYFVRIMCDEGIVTKSFIKK